MREEEDVLSVGLYERREKAKSINSNTEAIEEVKKNSHSLLMKRGLHA